MKFCGLVFLALIPTLYGFWKGEELRRELNLSKALLIFIEHILFQIENFSRDQMEIYNLFENRFLEKSGFLPHLRNETKSAPLLALNRTIDEHINDFYLTPKARECLLSFTAHFGTQSKEKQLGEGEKTVKILEKEFSTSEKTVLDKIKLGRVTGAAAGLGILILLL